LREEGKGKSEEDAKGALPEFIAAPPVSSPPLSFYPYLAAGLLLTLLAGPTAVAGVQAVPVPLKQSFDQFPMQLGPWEGRRVHIDPEILAATGADTALSADYMNPGQGPVSLWIAYYENQKSGASVHSPMTCLTGSGWKTVHAEVFELAPGEPINYLILEQAGKRLAVYYWYFERGRWLASDVGHKLRIGWDRLVSRRADGALVRLTTPVNPNVEQAKERLNDFAQFIIPVLPEFIKY
jgi:EpsI family protein